MGSAPPVASPLHVGIAATHGRGAACGVGADLASQTSEHSVGSLESWDKAAPDEGASRVRRSGAAWALDEITARRLPRHPGGGSWRYTDESDNIRIANNEVCAFRTSSCAWRAARNIPVPP